MTVHRVAPSLPTSVDSSALQRAAALRLLAVVARAARGSVAFLSGIVDDAQLGPAAGVEISRHAGGRI